MSEIEQEFFAKAKAEPAPATGWGWSWIIPILIAGASVGGYYYRTTPKPALPTITAVAPAKQPETVVVDVPAPVVDAPKPKPVYIDIVTGQPEVVHRSLHETLVALSKIAKDWTPEQKKFYHDNYKMDDLEQDRIKNQQARDLYDRQQRMLVPGRPQCATR